MPDLPPGALNALRALFTGRRVESPVRSFHGSPHKFDQFDLSKIGMGEGSQAYGYGLYFAENEGVAREYRDHVRDMAKVDAANRRLSELAREMEPLKLPGSYRTFRDSRGEQLAAEYDRLMAEKMAPGHLYEVNLHVDPDRLLDWDRPLREQPDTIQRLIPPSEPMTPQDMLRNFLATQYAQQSPSAGDVRTARRILTQPGYPEEIDEWAARQSRRGATPFNLVGAVGEPPQTATGGQLYKRLGASTAGEPQPSVAAARLLRDQGIPGIRYLDQGSRQAGEGTRNYVIFDPSVIEILRRYGIAGPVAGATVMDQLRQSSPQLEPVE